MARYMGIDFGEKRVGVAISDPIGIIAQPFKTLLNLSKKQLTYEIKKIIEEKNILKIIVGLPITLKGKDSAKTVQVREFVLKLKADLKMDIILEDERWTTKMAHQTLHLLGKKPSREKEKVDQLAAQAILQVYLDKKNYRKENVEEFDG